MIRRSLTHAAVTCLVALGFATALQAQHQYGTNLPRNYQELLQQRNAQRVEVQPLPLQPRPVRPTYVAPAPVNRRPHNSSPPRVNTSTVRRTNWTEEEMILGEEIVGEPMLGDPGIDEHIIDEHIIDEHMMGERMMGERMMGERLIGERTIGERMIREPMAMRRRYPIRSRLRGSNLEYEINAGQMSSGCDSCGECADPCAPCQSMSCPPGRRFSRPTFEIFAGTQAAVNPRYIFAPDRAADSSFGFHEGINWGFQFPMADVCGQLGARVTQSNFNGASFSPENREQYFVTGGLFRRKNYGLQGGVVADYLHDDWYVNMDLVQLRTELSWVFPRGMEFGGLYSGAMGSDTDLANFIDAAAGNAALQFNETWEGVTTYRFFLRSPLGRDGEGRVVLGFSDEGDTVFASDARFQISPQLGIQGGFDYLFPEDTNFPVNSTAHAWNVSLSLVWYPGGTRSALRRPSRPYFDVADNGSFQVSRVAP